MRGCTRSMVFAAAICLLAGCRGGPGQNPAATMTGSRVLVDATSGTTSRAHCKVVPDPFGGPDKVILGELVEDGRNKTSYFNDGGFFVVPAGLKGSVVVCLAVRKEAKIRIALVSARGALRSYYLEAPALDQWCELVLPLAQLAGKIAPGEKIVDISIWQLGGGSEAALYVDRILFRPE